MKSCHVLLTGALLLSATSMASLAEDSGTNVMFIFDSSGSMKKQIESGESRSDAAKRAMVAALSEMPAGASLGLLMYGHRRAKDCSDIEMVSPLGLSDSSGISQAILKSQPKGETPIAAALESAASSFAPLTGQSNSIVLVTDGIEECGGDPCAAARAIREAGTGLKAHVVGFTLNEKQRQTVQCVADETGGKYFDAQDADGLSDALAEVQKAVAEVPAKPARERVFFDDFDGADLSEQWVVNNPNPDGYIVENGRLLMTNAGGVSGFSESDTPNILLLEHPLPGGNWDLTVQLSGELKTGKDGVWFGLYTDANNFMSGSLRTNKDSVCSTFVLSLVRMSGGQRTNFDRQIRPWNGVCQMGAEALMAFLTDIASKGLTAKLTKRGREYRASLQIDGEVDSNGKPIIYETDALTSLRSPGKVALAVGQWEKAQGETLINVDSVTIESVFE